MNMPNVCRCGRASFAYADDTKILEQLIRKRETLPGKLVSMRVVEELKDLKRDCGFPIRNSTISNAKQMMAIFGKYKNFSEKLSYDDSKELESLWYLIEEDVQPKYRCGK
jgi:hypothetical protein